MTADSDLQNILAREAVDTGPYSPVRGVQAVLTPYLQQWGGQYLIGISPSGSFAKGTANRSGTDIDLFLSLSPQTPNTLKEIYETLFTRMQQAGGNPKRQCPRSAARFCRAYDELRNVLRPHSRHNQSVPADRRRLQFLRRTATVLAILQAA